MKALVRLSIAVLSAAVLLSNTFAGPSATPNTKREDQADVKVYVKIKAPETISEAVESQIIGQFKKLNNVSLVDDSDEADHIFSFDIHEARTRSDLLMGYEIVVIWTWRKGIRDIEKTYGESWTQDARDSFEQFVSGMSFYLSDEFYTCSKDELRQRLASIVARVDSQIFERIRKQHP